MVMEEWVKIRFPKWVIFTLPLTLWGDEVRILSGEEMIATHAKLCGTGSQSSDPAHYQGLFRERFEKKHEEPPRFDPWWKDEQVEFRDLGIYDFVANL